MKKPIPGYSEYLIDDQGNIFSKKGQLMSFTVNNKGYKTCKVRSNNKSKTMYVHRLVAITFLPNPENKPCVHHLNHNPLDCRLVNLEWCTYSENLLYDYKDNKRGKATASIKKSCSKIVLDLNTGVFYNSATEAALFNGVGKRYFCQMLAGIRNNKTSLVYC